MIKTIENMTISDKLSTIEKIWDSLSVTPESIPTPKWHLPILRQRAREAKDGLSTFKSWSKTKDDIRSRLK